MRALVAAAAAAVLLATSAYAQDKRSIASPSAPAQQAVNPQHTKADEKKYDAAVNFLGETPKKFDPWQNVREKPKPK